MTGPDPLDHGWWLASRAAGIVALLCITVSVAIGLAMAGRVSRNRAWRAACSPSTSRRRRRARRDRGPRHHAARRPLPRPRARRHRRAVRDPARAGLDRAWRHRRSARRAARTELLDPESIGPALWRRLHRATIVVYVLSVAHVLGATDAAEPWMRLLLLATGAPVLFLFVMRVVPAPKRSGMRRFRIAEVTPESADVTSFALEPVDGAACAVRAGPVRPRSGRRRGWGGRCAATRSAAPDPRRHRIRR